MGDQRGDYVSSVASADGYCFRLLADAITDRAICRLDEQGRVGFWNLAAERMLGYDAPDVMGRVFPCFSLTPGATHNATPQSNDVSLPDSLAEVTPGQNHEFQEWCECKDGSRFQARVIIAASQDPSGTRSSVLIIQNLTQSTTVRQALFDSEQRFRLMVQGVHDYAIYMLDPQGYITNWNSGAALIKGYEEDEIIGRHFSCFYTPEDQASDEPRRSLTLALKNNTFQTEAWRMRKDGSRFWASVVIDPIFGEDGRLLGYAKVTRDITQQKLNREKEDQKREALHQSQKLEAVGRLTGSVVHDFNNFLAIIRTAAELLESSPNLTLEKRQRYTQMILDTSRRASRLIDQLLSFARRQPLHHQVFCIRSRIEEFLPIIETTVGSRRHLELQFSDDLAPVDTDPSQFETAVLNMVINARDATPEGGTISIRAYPAVLELPHKDEKSKEQAFTALSVSDTGTGIDPTVLSNIFEPFFTTKGLDKGTGLGLSQVYGFAKQSGGDVTVESQLGEGTCFTLYLPCATRQPTGWDDVLSPLAQSMFHSK